MLRLALATALLMLSLAPLPAHAAGKLGLYVIYMEPNGADAENYGEGAFGYGGHVVAPLPRPFHPLAGVFVVENVDLKSSVHGFHEEITGLYMEQHTRQRYTRIAVGAELGGHGTGFFRPHIGMNLAAINYGYSIDIVIPDDYDEEDDVQQCIDERDRWVFGQDVTAGVDLRVSRILSFDLALRYLKSYDVPVELGRDWVKVSPEYFQVYLGIGVAFDAFSTTPRDD